MNAPTMPMQGQPPPAPGASQYPSGADVAQQMGEQGQPDLQVDNPVIAGFRSIMMFIQELVKRGDPRGQAAAQSLAGVLQALQGAPMEPPMPAPPPAGGPEAIAAGEMGPEQMMPGGPAPEMPPEPPMGAPGAGGPMPPAGGAPAAGPAPSAPQAPAAANPAPAGPKAMPMMQGGNTNARPMHSQPMPQGKRPVVLT